MEMDIIDQIVDYVTENVHERVCLYLVRSVILSLFSLFYSCCSCVKYVPEPEDTILLKTSLDIYKKFHQYSHALRLALMLNDHALIREIFLECPDK